jgi:hypothetical protein
VIRAVFEELIVAGEVFKVLERHRWVRIGGDVFFETDRMHVSITYMV